VENYEEQAAAVQPEDTRNFSAIVFRMDWLEWNPASVIVFAIGQPKQPFLQNQIAFIA